MKIFSPEKEEINLLRHTHSFAHTHTHTPTHTGNGIDGLNSNAGRSCVSLYANALEKGMNL